MKLLFNKNSEGRKEMLKHFSQIPGTLEFEDIEPDVDMAQEEVARYVSRAVVSLCLNHYHSPYYMIEPPSDLTPEELARYAVLDELVRLCQAPVALLAYRDYAKNRDMTHSSTGRVVRMDKDSDEVNIKLIDADDMALMQKGLRAIDRLIRYVDEIQLEQWISSPVYLQTRDLILWDADMFSRYFPIEQSRRIYMMVCPMIRKVQSDQLIPRLGQGEYDQFMDRVRSTVRDSSPIGVSGSGASALSPEDQTLFDLMAYPVAELAMAEAYLKLPVQLFPESVLRQLWGPGNGISGLTLRERMVHDLTQQGLKSLVRLEDELTRRRSVESQQPITDQTIVDIADRMDPINLYARV